MDLNENEVEPKKLYSGVGIFSAPSGKKMEIKIAGKKELDVRVPDGKNWERIEVHVHVVEVDA